MFESICASNTKINKAIKILLIHPIDPQGNQSNFFEYKADFLMPTTHVDQTFCPGAPKRVTTRQEYQSASEQVIKKVNCAQLHGYDAAVINCSSEPYVREAKRVVEIPVIGTKESTRAIASLISKRASFVYPRKIPVLELENDLEFTYRELVKQCEKEIKKGVDLLIPDCNMLDQFSQRLQNDLDIPVLMNRDMALMLAEMFAAFGAPCKKPLPFKLSANIGWLGYRFSKQVSRLAYLVKWNMNVAS